MRKKELIKALEIYDDNDDVIVMDDYPNEYEITNITFDDYSGIILNIE